MYVCRPVDTWIFLKLISVDDEGFVASVSHNPLTHALHLHQTRFWPLEYVTCISVFL